MQQDIHCSTSKLVRYQTHTTDMTIMHTVLGAPASLFRQHIWGIPYKDAPARHVTHLVLQQDIT